LIEKSTHLAIKNKLKISSFLAKGAQNGIFDDRLFTRVNK